jgi:hypothetical protein
MMMNPGGCGIGERWKLLSDIERARDKQSPHSHWRQKMKWIISTGVAVTAIAVIAAACGGATGAPKATTSTTAPTTSTTVPSATRTREATTFLKLVSPYNLAVKKLDASKSDSTTTSELQASLAPLVTASNTFTSGILSASFTGQAATAARTMAIAVEAVVADIQSVTIATWVSERSVIAHAEETVGDESNVVRADVGLPAVTT